MLLMGADIISDPRRWVQQRSSVGFWHWKRFCAYGAALEAGRLLGLSNTDVFKLMAPELGRLKYLNDEVGREAVIAHMRERAKAF